MHDCSKKTYEPVDTEQDDVQVTELQEIKVVSSTEKTPLSNDSEDDVLTNYRSISSN